MKLPMPIGVGGGSLPDPRLTAASLRTVLRTIWSRHDALRSAVLDQPGAASQRLMPASAIPTHLVSAVQGAAELLRAESRARIELITVPAVRVLLARGHEPSGRPAWQLTINIHHIATDGWSNGSVLAPELKQLLRAARGTTR